MRVLLWSAYAVSFVATAGVFNPRDYKKSTATCSAVYRGNNEEQDTTITLSYVDVNPGTKPTILMVHGWPSLWSTWSSQITEFHNNYRLIAPDLRGFGGSTHPGDARKSGSMPDMVGDMVCVLQRAGVSSAVCMGHDWGAQVCYEAARMRPDLFTGVIGVAIPYLPAAGDFVPTQHLAVALPKLSYQLFFNDHTTKAVKQLDQDIRRTVRAILRDTASPPPDAFLGSKDSFLEAWDGVQDIPPVPFFSPEEEDYFVEQYSIQGFKNTLQFYMEENRKGSWTFAHEQGNHTIPQPVLSILPRHDPVADWALALKILKSEQFLPNGHVEFMDGSHWCHMEYPEVYNAFARQWLDQHFREKNAGHDEL
ncbi:unnamed protein product [Mycena citricolor]|uniref:AB hydrolase-1 domain-containing protein n=1 Tax=Mycena citricolor TaxID=2018698 RepID=A0AAD2K301_9AGAR|nr:unnamed protein product [Mycena citricolor]